MSPHEPRRKSLGDRDRFMHMLRAAQDAVEFMSDKQLADIESDAMLRRAVVNAVQEIGEAASRVSDTGRLRAPELPWPKMVGMRHILVHDYWLIDLKPLATVVQRDLPQLISAMSAALAGWPESAG